MAVKSRQSFSGEFKARVALEVMRGVKTVNDCTEFWCASYQKSVKFASMISGIAAAAAGQNPMDINIASIAGGEIGA